MKLYSLAIILMLLTLFPIICVSEPGAKVADGISVGETAVCNDTRVRVRSTPNLQGETLGHLDVDEHVEVLDRSAKKMMIGDMVSYWYKVRRLRDNLTGWSYGYFLEPEKKRLAGIKSLYPYLIDGVNFHISEDDVPVYAEPKEDAAVLFTMLRGEAVTPIQVSDHPDPSAIFGKQEFWYLCVVNSDTDLVGWIRRPGLTCNLDSGKDEVHVVRLHLRRDGYPGIIFLQSFIEGAFQRVQLDKRMLQPGSVYTVFDTDGERVIGKIEITDTDPGADAARWIEGGEHVRSIALLDPKGKITLGWSEHIPTLRLKHRPPMEVLYEYLRSEFARVTGKENVELDETDSVIQTSLPVPVTDNGKEFAGEVTYHAMGGQYEGWSIGFRCFLIQHPNGDAVRSNTSFHVREVDEDEEASWKEIVSSVKNGSLPMQVDATATEHFTRFPATLITLNHEIYEGSESYLSVTNGYIVFNIGQWYHRGP